MNPALNETIDTGYQRPRDPAEIWLARQWQHILGFAVGIRENFFGVGGNSLDAARVIDAILVEFGVQLPLNVLTEHPTVERLATLLRDHAERLSGPLVAIQDGDGTRPPLFLVHPDNGQVGPYCGLAHALGEEFAVFGIQAVGLYSDAEPRRTVPAMAAAYVDAVRAVRPTGPYLLGGCAIGAAIAYEMAARLDDVRLVAAIDLNCWNHRTPAPSPGRSSRPGSRTCRGSWRAGRSATWYRTTWHPSSSRARCACGRPTRTPCATGGHRRTPGRSTSSACRRPWPCRRPLSSGHTSAARTGAWPTRCASCSADQR